ncbi:sporulation histidine kinase inhibitor Sda [Ammoniphilus sp. CFH 90114]|nr:sporulation histidine kinase inhibitor Sda [Ammoniphilus sp. CFH 90114]RXT15099.1 sporulation histidine kinase inhibitor Sda [Ammoniphilus sp. CFH 90114]
MKLLSDDALIEAYHKSVNLDLDKDFIGLLLDEIHQRKLDLRLAQP